MFAEVIGAVTGPAILVSRFGFKTSSLLAILFAVGATACVPTALVASSAAAIASLVFFALALGAIPILNAQISNEASVEMQGRVAGFNYAVMTLAWVSSPYAYYTCLRAQSPMMMTKLIPITSLPALSGG